MKIGTCTNSILVYLSLITMAPVPAHKEKIRPDQDGNLDPAVCNRARCFYKMQRRYR